MPIPTSSKQSAPPSSCQGPRRIAVIGTTGSGKTTVARQLAQRLGLIHVELDALHWQRDWAQTPLDLFREQVSAALDGDAWVVDGNYSKVRDIIWPRADTIVWLDYGLPRIMFQLLQRTLQRIFGREVLWNENREHFREQFLSRDSLFLWALKSRPRHRRTYPHLFHQTEYAHLHVVRLRSPRATRQWLDSLN